MELVYLWIEDYKNIKNQGFNFSPRFTCKYDTTRKELEIIDKEETGEFYPKDFFGENINITAIVGENGSGKSSILNILYKGLVDFDFRGFAIFSNQKQEIFYLSCSHKNYSFLGKKYKKLYDENQIEFPFFNYSFTYDIYADESKELIFPKKNYRRIKGMISLPYELIRNQKNILLNYFELKRNSQLEKFKKFFIPKTINIFFDYSRIENYYQEKQTKETKDSLKSLLNQIFPNRTIDDFFTILKEVSNLLNKQNSYEKPKSDFDFFNPSFELGNTDDENIYFNLWEEKDYLSKVDLKQHSKNSTIEVVNHNDTWISDLRLKVLSFDIDKLNEEIIKVILASFSSEYFVIQLCDSNNKKLNDLSYGEQQLIFILNQLYALSYYFPLVGSTNNFLVLLDEIELGFHPKWQKNTISYILDFLKLISNKYFHLIFTSHSPFILSDIPKQNIIFLKDGKQVEAMDKKQTFGANIHTLLADGFFMDGGLMGEFAKSKIEEVIRFLNSENKNTKSEINSKEEAQKIINIIGEPILKSQLQRMLDSKRVDKIDELEEEIELLKHRLEIMRKNQ